MWRDAAEGSSVCQEGVVQRCLACNVLMDKRESMELKW